ncbi:hypothetical protein TYRP_006017, partial [Tyrophagus putrescentiae]
LLNMNNYTQ